MSGDLAPRAPATEGNGVQDSQPPLLKDLHHHSPLPLAAVGRKHGDGDGPATNRPTPPADCQRILIVGAGGFGREVLNWARDAWPDATSKIAGFLSSNPNSLNGYGAELPILGDPEAFRPEEGDAFLLAIGIPNDRRRVAESLTTRGAKFICLIHPTAIIAPTASIGSGTIACPYAIVSDSASVGQFTLLNYGASLGHDASTGDFCVLSPYAALGGGANLGNDVFLGMHASVGPSTKIGDRSKITANCAALKNVPDDALVFGSPARTSPLISTELR